MMFALVWGLIVGGAAAVADRLKSRFGWFPTPFTRQPTIGEIVARVIGWTLLVLTLLVFTWLVLSAATADGIVGRGGILGRILDTTDGIVMGLFSTIQALIPRIELG